MLISQVYFKFVTLSLLNILCSCKYYKECRLKRAGSTDL